MAILRVAQVCPNMLFRRFYEQKASKGQGTLPFSLFGNEEKGILVCFWTGFARKNDLNGEN